MHLLGQACGRCLLLTLKFLLCAYVPCRYRRQGVASLLFSQVISSARNARYVLGPHRSQFRSISSAPYLGTSMLDRAMLDRAI